MGARSSIGSYLPNVSEANGVVRIASLPTFSNDSQAGQAGLVQGDLYIRSSGSVRAKL